LDPSAAPERPAAEPWAYFLTFTCYGAKLHGDARGSVDREHNAPRGRCVPENAQRERHEQRLMSEAAVTLSAAEREVVLEQIKGVCEHEGWALHAAHVRSTHVHLVVTATIPPQEATRKLKAYSSRALNERFGLKARRWATHGSMVWLWEPNRLDRAVDYVVRGQGKPMALYVNTARWSEYMEMP
jgi:REP element-mobilizing transposase RayT